MNLFNRLSDFLSFIADFATFRLFLGILLVAFGYCQYLYTHFVSWKNERRKKRNTHIRILSHTHTHSHYTLLDECEWNTMALVNMCLLQNIKLCDKCNSLGLRSQFHRWVHLTSHQYACVLWDWIVNIRNRRRWENEAIQRNKKKNQINFIK